MPAFLDEVIEPFYVQAPTAKGQYAFGQLFWVHAYYPHERLEVWRPEDYDVKLGFARNFNAVDSPPDLFKRPLPYSKPPLRTNEEFLVLRSKPRPALLISPPDQQLDSIRKGDYGGKIARHLCTVALIFSAANDAGDAKFSPEFLDRVRHLRYPQFMFLPKRPPLSRDSLLRLDEVQSVAINHLQPMGFRLSDDADGILRSQLRYFQTGSGGDNLADWADQLQ